VKSASVTVINFAENHRLTSLKTLLSGIEEEKIAIKTTKRTSNNVNQTKQVTKLVINKIQKPPTSSMSTLKKFTVNSVELKE